MKKIFNLALLIAAFYAAHSQSRPGDLYTLVKKLSLDTLEDMRDWGVGQPSLYPVKWDKDNVTMSDDIKINFFRTGWANIATKSGNTSCKVMIYGPRSGFNSYMILGTVVKDYHSKPTLDSVLGKNPYSAKLLKACDKSDAGGFYYYELKLPKKSLIWVKLTYVCNAAGCSVRLTQYNEYTKADVKLDCP